MPTCKNLPPAADHSIKQVTSLTTSIPLELDASSCCFLLAFVHVQFAAVLESLRALTIKNSVTELLRLPGDVFRDQASLGQICDCLHCRAIGRLCPVL